MNAKIETPDMMIYAMASEIEDFNTVLHGVSSPLPILAMSVARNTHAPDMAYISGAEGVDPELNRIYPSSLRSGPARRIASHVSGRRPGRSFWKYESECHR
jgi:hypothetical protein